MKKRIVAVTCVLMFCLGLIGCGTERADKTQQLIRGAAPGYNDGLIRVGMIQTGKESDWRDAIRSIVIRALFSPFAEKLVEMKNALAEDIKYHRVRRNPDDGRDYEGEIETLSDGLTSLERQLGENLFVSLDDKAEISAYLRDFYKELAFTRQDTMKLYEV